MGVAPATLEDLRAEAMIGEVPDATRSTPSVKMAISTAPGLNPSKVL